MCSSSLPGSLFNLLAALCILFCICVTTTHPMWHRISYSREELLQKNFSQALSAASGSQKALANWSPSDFDTGNICHQQQESSTGTSCACAYLCYQETSEGEIPKAAVSGDCPKERLSKSGYHEEEDLPSNCPPYQRAFTSKQNRRATPAYKQGKTGSSSSD
jgi:hypothetical protein